MRKTSREISRLLASAKAQNPATVPEFAALVVGTDKMLKFTGTVKIGADTYTCASDMGRVKVFANIDDFLKFAAKSAEVGDGVYTVTINTGSLLASSVPANMTTWAQAQIVKLGKVKTNQQGVIAQIDVDLAAMVGWDTGNQAQRAKLAETQAQRVAVVEDVAAIDAELARLAALV